MERKSPDDFWYQCNHKQRKLHANVKANDWSSSYGKSMVARTWKNRNWYGARHVKNRHYHSFTWTFPNWVTPLPTPIQVSINWILYIFQPFSFKKIWHLGHELAFYTSVIWVIHFTLVTQWERKIKNLRFRNTEVPNEATFLIQKTSGI